MKQPKRTRPVISGRVQPTGTPLMHVILFVRYFGILEVLLLLI